MAQQDLIQQEIALQNPLVSERLELSALYEDDIHQQEIKELHKKSSHIRKTGPDCSYFYGAIDFSHLEALLDDSKELQRFKALSAKSKEDLVSVPGPIRDINNLLTTTS